jgi:hypothetical protein|nr:hypothetical protein [uncultured Acetatifactor sp.]
MPILQRFTGTLATEKDSEIYEAMKVRYMELKVILTASGINLAEIDRIKE